MNGYLFSALNFMKYAILQLKYIKISIKNLIEILKLYTTDDILRKKKLYNIASLKSMRLYNSNSFISKFIKNEIKYINTTVSLIFFFFL